MAKTKNSFGTPYLTQGPPKLLAVLNAHTAAIDALRVQRSVDMDALVTPEGTLLTIRNPATIKRQSTTTSPSYPFDLTLTDAGATYTGNFRPGTVNGLIPSNYLSLTGIAKTGTVYIKIAVTLTNAAVQTATFSATGTAPAAMPTSMGVPPTSVEILTHVVVNGTVFRVLGPGNPWLTPTSIFETDKSGTISPGEKPTDVWYTYNLSSVV